MPERVPTPPSVIFDLDGVLSTRDTFSALVTGRFRERPQVLPKALPALVEWARSRHDVERSAAAARRVAEVALRGVDERRYRQLAADLGARLGGNPAWVRADLVHTVRQTRRAGHAVVIATATERVLARSFLRAIGVEWDLLIASDLGWTGSGPCIQTHCRGAAKLRALQQSGVTVVHSRFYTDSYDDWPTARAAAEVVLVHPGRRSRQRYARSGLVFTSIP